MIDLLTEEFANLTNEQRYSAIVAFAKAQPTESNRHDFKVIWSNDALRDVAAFANTFGGLLIIGVEKNQKDVIANVIGVSSSSELTTGIASAIATNISPTPSYDVMECYKPGETNCRFCVIRVRSDSRLYLVTKKDISPAWVRNADQTIRADAAQLRGLIDRERQSASNTFELFGHRRAHDVLEEMSIGEKYVGWPTGQWHMSNTHFKLAILPVEKKVLALDEREEHSFVNLIHRNYRRVLDTVGGAASQYENRSADYYEYRWYHKNLDYEARWRITNNLEIAHATQIREDGEWSIMDVVAYTVLLIKVAARRWKSLNYYGDGVLFANLAVGNLHLRQGQAGQFSGLFNPGGGEFAIRPDALNVHSQQREKATGDIALSFSAMHEDLPRTVTSLMNTLVRSLGHSLVWSEFEENIRDIIE